jgi:hypothetical protein
MEAPVTCHDEAANIILRTVSPSSLREWAGLSQPQARESAAARTRAAASVAKQVRRLHADTRDRHLQLGAAACAA